MFVYSTIHTLCVISKNLKIKLNNNNHGKEQIKIKVDN